LLGLPAAEQYEVWQQRNDVT